MAWTDACKIAFRTNATALITQQKGRKNKTAVLRKLGKDTGIPFETLKRWYYEKEKNSVNNDTTPETTENNSENDKSNTTPAKSNRGGKREGAGRKKIVTFNLEKNNNIKWAKWTWNPVTGCKHGCNYCYARDIANRFYKEKFEPTFRPGRLVAPQNTKIPQSRINEPGIRNVFVCSMADLFGDWVPDEWINKVMDAVRQAEEWEFIFLTKNPKRYLRIDWPDNAWIGATADTQQRAIDAGEVFSQIKNNNIKFLSCEPLIEPITLHFKEQITWLIIGGQSKSRNCPEFQPEWKWVKNLLIEAWKADIAVYFKDNLTVKPEEYPE